MTVSVSLIPAFFPGSLRAKGDDLDVWQNAINSRINVGTQIDESLII